MRRLLLAAALLLAALPGAARANLAQSRPRPGVLGGAATSGPTPIRVVAEELEFRCASEHRLPVCRFEARYRFRNPAPTPQAADAVFYGVDATELRALQDGRPIGRELPAIERRQVGQELARGSDVLASPGGRVSRAGLRIELPAGGTALVAVEGRIAPGRYFEAGYQISVPRARHLLLGSAAPRSNLFHLEYLVSPIRTWGPAPEIAVSVSYPRSWQLQVLARPGSLLRPERSAAGGRLVERFRIEGARVDTLTLAMEVPPPLPFNGGLLLGIGGNLDDSGGLRARFGYEIAAPEWLLLSLAVDTNFRDDVVLAPGIEAATPSILGIIPSLGVGLGAPVRLVERDRRVGLRVQLTVHWPILGWVTCFDLYPGQGFDEPRRFQVAMLAQIGL